MMINAVSFTGRETMLTKGLKSAGEDIAVKTYEYLGAGKIFKNVEAENTITKSVYKSPFELVDIGTDNTAKSAVRVIASEPMSMSYAVSHGTPEAHVGGRISFIG